MICFLCPFALVSCDGETVRASGVELMLAVPIANEELKDVELDSPNPFLLIAFALGIIGLVCITKAYYRDKHGLAAGCCAAGGVLCLLLFRSAFWDFYELDEYGSYVSVRFLWGWMLSLLAYIGAGGVSFFYQYVFVTKRTRQFERESHSFSVTSPSAKAYSAGYVAPKPEVSAPNGKVLNKDAKVSDEDIPPQNAPVEQETPPHTVLRYSVKDKEMCVEISKYPCIIGRDSSSCDIVIEDAKVSRVHAQLDESHGDVHIMDLKSSNGITVNGDRTEVAELLSGDEVLIGTTHIRIEIRI